MNQLLRRVWLTGTCLYDGLCAARDGLAGWLRRRPAARPPARRPALAVEPLERREMLSGNPVANPDSYSTLHDHTLTVSAGSGVLANDTGGNGPLSAQFVGGPQYGSVSLASNGGFTYQPPAHFVGTDAFGYRAFDGTNYSTPTSVTINVTDQAPTAGSASYSVAEGQTLTTYTGQSPLGLLSHASDPDGDTLTITGHTSPQHGTLTSFNSSDGTFVYTAPSNYFGTDLWSYTVSDGIATASGGVTITVTPPPPSVTGVAVSASEGLSFGGTVVTFTSQDSNPGHFTASIAWGDGTTSAGSVSSNGSGGFNVFGSHPYAEEGADTVTVTVTDAYGGTGSASDSVTVADPPVTVNGGRTLPATEGAAFSGATVATFTDPAGAEAVGDYSATIAWGDGGSSAGTITLSGGTFTVTGGYTYAEEGHYTPTVTVNHDGVFASATDTANVLDPPVSATGVNFPAAEGQAFTGQTVATFTDPAGAEVVGDYSATINWGDGTSPSSGTITAGGGTFAVKGGHTYTEEGSYTVSVTIAHEGAGSGTTATATVSELAVVATTGFTAVEEQPFSGQAVATFTDPGDTESVSDYSATIAWGDGSAATTGTISYDFGSGVYTVHGGHTYAEEGNYAATVTVTHEGTVTTATGVATASDPAVVASGGHTVAATEGSDTGLHTLATFTDPAGAEALDDYTATIDWGDGSDATDGTVTVSSGTFTVQDGHTYAEEGSHTVTVTIEHEGVVTTTTDTATVADPAVVAAGVTLTATEGTAFSGVAVATFTDPGGAEDVADYSATITWGDGGSSAGTITYDAGTDSFTVAGGHTYAEEGSYTTAVTLSHDSAPSAVAHGTAAVADAAPAVTAAAVAATEGAAFSGTVASFTEDDGSPAGFSATIAWGDGDSTSGTVTIHNGGGFDVQGTHTYAEEGSYTVAVSVADPDGNSDSSSATATVSDPAVSATGGFTVTATEGSDSGAQTVATFTDPGGAEPLDDYSADVAWGDGTTTAGTITYDAGTGTFSVQADHAYAEEGDDTVTVTVHHDSASDAVVTSAAAVADAAPAVTVADLQATEGAAVTATVASFTEDDGEASDFTATIAWGDGASTSGTVVANSSGGFDVQGTHTYAEEGSYSVTVTATDPEGNAGSASAAATVADPAVSATGGFTVTATEGSDSGLQTVATFTDSGGAEAGADYSATVDWGDGGSSAGVVSYDATHHQFVVEAGHLYTDWGGYDVTVTVHHEQAADVSVSAAADVADAPLTAATLAPAASPLDATEGVALDDGAAVATFTDEDLADTAAAFTATIDWGDGTAAGAGRVEALGDGSFEVLPPDGGHTYSRFGVYPLTVTLAASDGRTAAAYTTAAVAEQDLILTAADPLTATRNVPLSGLALASFTDADTAATAAGFTVAIDWGDGTSGTGTVSGGAGSFNITAGHTFALAGAFTARVAVQEGGVTTALTGVNITVAADAPPPTPLDVTAVRLDAIVGHVSNVPDGVVATFTDLNPAHLDGSHTATVAWGDGTTTTAAIGPEGAGGVYQVSASHAYAHAGSFLVAVTVRDQTGHAAPGYATARVTEALSVSALPLAAAAGEGFAGLAVASVTGGWGGLRPGDLAASIDWGDGSAADAGTLVGRGGQLWVLGGHTYAHAGNFVTRVTVIDGDTAAAGSDAGATVSAALAGADTALPLTTFADGNVYEAAPGFAAAVDWGDGGADAGTVAGGTGLFGVAGTHAWALPGSYTVTTTTQDDPDEGGNTVVSSVAVGVSARPLAADSVAGLSGTEEVALTDAQVALFTPGPAAGVVGAATIAWGDGTASAGTVVDLGAGQYAIEGSHTYAEAGTYAVVAVLAAGGSSQVFFNTATVGDAALTATPAIDLTTLAGGSTGTLTVGGFTDDNAHSGADDFTATIAWGDGLTSAGTVSGGAGSFQVAAAHTYAAPGTYHFTVTARDAEGATASATGTATVLGTALGVQRSDDPQGVLLSPVGEVQVDKNLGGLRLSHALDFDMSPGTAAGGDPALVYNSSTIYPRPILKVLVGTDPLQPLPSEIDVRLTWNGVTQDWVSFATTGHAPGDDYALAVQVADPVAATGVYAWTLDVRVHYTDSLIPAATVSGQTPVVVGDSGIAGPAVALGAGWGIAGIDRLVPELGGILWVTAAGDTRFFADDSTNTAYGDGHYISPPEDFGILTQNDDFTFTYRTKDQIRWDFSSDGRLLDVTDPHDVARTYQWHDGQLTGVTAPDGGVTTLATAVLPDGSRQTTITEPGGRALTLTLAVPDGNALWQLVGLTDVDGSSRAFSYTLDRLTRDQWAPLDSAFSYDPTTGLLSAVDWGNGLGSVYQVTPAAAQGLQTAPAEAADQEGVAVLTDPLDHPTHWSLDVRGRPLSEDDADGAHQEWDRNGRGQVVAYLDPRGFTTGYVYAGNSAGDLLEVDNPDGSFSHYQYDPTFHEVTREEDSVTATQTVVTTWTYDPTTGDMLSETQADSTTLAVMTAWTWAAGLQVSSTDPDGNQVLTTYDTHRRPVEADTDDAAGDLAGSELWTYDASGEVHETLDHLGNYTLTEHDGRGQVLEQETFDADGTLIDQSESTYLAAGLLNETTDGDGNSTGRTYDTRGLQRSEAVHDADGTLVNEAEQNYNAAGQLTETVDGDGNRTEMGRDAVGREVSEQVFNAAGTEVSAAAWQYDLADEVVVTTDGDGGYVRDSYDSMGQMVAEATFNAAGTEVSAEAWGYNLAGQQTAQTDGDGNVTAATLDLLGRVTEEQVVSPTGVVVGDSHEQYDRDGEATGEVDGAGNVTRRTFDADGNVLTEKVYAPDGVTLVSSVTNEYDLAGNCTRSTDGDNNVTVRTFDGDGRVITEKLYNAAGVLVSETDDRYDDAGNLIREVDGDGNITLRTFDGDGNVLTEKLYAPDGVTLVRSTVNQYDLAGNLTLETDGDNNYTVRTFDAEDRVISENTYNAAGTLVSGTQDAYDLAGNAVREVDGDGNITLRTFDAAGQVLTEKVYAPDGVTLIASSADQYDLAGNLVRETDGDNNYTIRTFDADGRVIAEDVYAADGALISGTQDQYDEDGNPLREVDGAGNITLRTFDAEGQVLTEKVYAPDGVTLVRSTVNQYDLAGNLTVETDGDNNYTVRTFDAAGNVISENTYNAAGSLVSGTQDQYDPDGNPIREVDGAGNITLRTFDAAGNVLTERVYAPDGITLVRSTTNVYDPAGNCTRSTDGDNNYTVRTFDAAGNVISENTYNAAGTLVSGTQDQYDGDGNPIREIDGAGNITLRTFDAEGQVLTEKVYAPDGTTLIRSTVNQYDLAGNAVRSADGDNNYTIRTFDAEDRVISENTYNAAGTLVSGTQDQYDGDGNPVREVDGAGNITLRTFDAEGNVLTERVYAPDGVTLIASSADQYDLDGNLIRETDGDNNYTIRTFDADGRVISENTYNAAGTLVSGTQDQYDGDGNPIREVDGAGNITLRTFDAEGQVLTERVYAPDGTTLVRSTVNQYDPAGNAVRSTDGDNNYTVRTFDAAGRVISENTYNAAGTLVSGTQDQYDPDGNPIREVDGAGNITLRTFDAAGNVLTAKVYAPDGITLVRSTTNVYDPAGNCTRTTDGDNNYTVRTFDAEDRVISENAYNAAGTLVSGTQDQYDGDGNPVREVDGAGNITLRTFDAVGNVLTEKVYAPDGTTLVSSVRNQYDLAGNRTRSVDGDGNCTVRTFDANGRVISENVYNADGTLASSTLDQYDGDGNTVREVDGTGNITLRTFDAVGNVLTEKVYAPDGTTLVSALTNQYDAAGNCTRTTDGDGNYTLRTFDAEGRVLTENSYAAAGTFISGTQDQYDGDGNPVREVDGSGNVTLRTFDAAGRVVREDTYAADGTWLTSTLDQYDLAGNPVRDVDHVGNITLRTFDAAGNVLTEDVYAPDGTTLVSGVANAYDADGNCVRTADGDGHVTVRTFDAAGRKTSETTGYGAAQAATSTWQYDLAGNLVAFTDPDGNTTYYSYNALGEQTFCKDALLHVSTQTFDGAGRLSSATDADGRRRDLTYDAAGRLLTETWYAPDGVAVLDTLQYTYDLAGRLLTAGNDQGSYAFTYDGEGRVVGVSEPFGLSLAFSYDGAGDRTAVVDSLGGQVASVYEGDRLVRRTFTDASGLALRLGLTYDGDGNLLTITRYSDLAGTQLVATTTYSYNAAGQVASISHTGPDGAALADFGYSYDPAGLVTAETDDGTTTPYTYDASGQLTAAGSQDYAYDANGNPAGSGVVVGLNNQVLSDGTWDYTYDAAGNVTEKVNAATGEDWTYGYGARNELIWVEQRASAGGTLEMRADYKYDVFGNRVEKDVTTAAGTAVTRYGYDGWDSAKGSPVGTENFDVWGEVAADGSLTTRYVHGDAVDQLFASVGAGEVPAWYLTDRLGSIRGVTDGAGVLRDRIAYSPFGAVTSETDPGWGGHYKWDGREFDVETQLYNNRARYYDPATGRWLSEDPLGFDAGDSNLYRYVHNAPTVGTDPSGLQERPGGAFAAGGKEPGQAALGKTTTSGFVKVSLSAKQLTQLEQFQKAHKEVIEREKKQVEDLKRFVAALARDVEEAGKALAEYDRTGSGEALKQIVDRYKVSPRDLGFRLFKDQARLADLQSVLETGRTVKGQEAYESAARGAALRAQLDAEAAARSRPEYGKTLGPSWVELSVAARAAAAAAKAKYPRVQVEVGTLAGSKMEMQRVRQYGVGDVLSLLQDTAQVVVGVVVFPAQPGVGAYLIYRGVEGGYATLSGNQRWTTQLAKLSGNDQLVFLTETMLPQLDMVAMAMAGGGLLRRPTPPTAEALEAEIRNISRTLRDTGFGSQEEARRLYDLRNALRADLGRIVAAQVAPAASPAATPAQQVAGNAARGFGNLQCQEAANAMQQALERAGHTGQLIELRAVGGQDFIICNSLPRGAPAISQNGRHVGVRVGDLVFDNLHPNGMPYTQWIADFDAIDGIRVHSVTSF